MLYVPNRWNDGDDIFRNSVAIFSNMTSTVDYVKQIRTLITFKNDLGADSRVTNSQFNERNIFEVQHDHTVRKKFWYVCLRGR